MERAVGLFVAEDPGFGEDVSVVDAAVVAPEARVSEGGDEGVGRECRVVELVVGEVSDFGQVCWAEGAFVFFPFVNKVFQMERRREWVVCLGEDGDVLFFWSPGFIFRQADVQGSDVGMVREPLGVLFEVLVEHCLGCRKVFRPWRMNDVWT